jgi:hypothetical protein
VAGGAAGGKGRGRGSRWFGSEGRGSGGRGRALGDGRVAIEALDDRANRADRLARRCGQPPSLKTAVLAAAVAVAAIGAAPVARRWGNGEGGGGGERG